MAQTSAGKSPGAARWYALLIFTLAYALNMHMAQGITTDKAITVMDSHERNLSNQRLFNVGVTRVRDAITMVVDDKEKLQRQLDHNPGDKTSALETLGRLDIDGGKRAADPAKFDPGPIEGGAAPERRQDADNDQDGGYGECLAQQFDVRRREIRDWRCNHYPVAVEEVFGTERGETREPRGPCDLEFHRSAVASVGCRL